MIRAMDLVEKFQYALNCKWGYIWGTAGVKWTQARQEALEKTTDKNREQGRKYGSKWIGHTVADCSGLFSWAFKKLGGEMYHGSNTMYLKWCTDKGELKKGKRTDGKELKPGTAVFVWNGQTYSHVGLYVGDGNVIEAATTQQGVITSKVTNTKWTHWGELKGVSYAKEIQDPGGQPAEETEKDPTLPTLRRGSKGEAVKKLQQALVDHGYSIGASGIDGDYGPATEKAVKQFQKDWGLAEDGIAGDKTWKLLMSAPVKEQRYKVTILGLDLTQARAIQNNYPGSIIEEE